MRPEGKQNVTSSLLLSSGKYLSIFLQSMHVHTILEFQLMYYQVTVNQSSSILSCVFRNESESDSDKMYTEKY